ncbi:hypothetical protein SAMN06298216_4061 [Spirosomataceae bacterium TFI 002]|nr:hypothetical protein SAMN06298216_4061 [Spirosomataceae bacterium TFI 002]
MFHNSHQLFFLIIVCSFNHFKRISFYVILILIFACNHTIAQDQIVTEQLPVISNFQELANVYKASAKKEALKNGFDDGAREKDEYYGNDNKSEAVLMKSTSVNLPSPEPLISFLGSEKTLNPQDPMGAVGEDYIITSDNAMLRVHDKTGNTLSTVITSGVGGFWTELIDNGGFPADPWAVYDPFSKRWIIIAALFRGVAGDLPIDLLIAVSQTSNPLGNWNKYKVIEKGGHTTNVGFSKKWIATSGGIVFDKNVLYDGLALSYTNFRESRLRGKVVCTLDSLQEDLYMIRNNVFINGNISTTAINKITGNVSSPSLVNAGYVLNSIFPTGAAKSNVILKNGSIWAAFGNSCGSWGQYCQNIVWGQIDLTNFSAVQSGVISEPGFNYTNTSIAVNSNNDVIIGYTYMGTGIYPSAAYSFRYGIDPLNSMRNTKIFQAGQNNCSPYRWGDYAISCLDPDGYSLWTLQQAAMPSAPYPNYIPCDQSFWAKVDLNPNCTNLTLLDDILSGTEKHEASVKIEANNLIDNGTNVEYDAGKYILLNPGFKVQNGGIFKANIDGCGNQ